MHDVEHGDCDNGCCLQTRQPVENKKSKFPKIYQLGYIRGTVSFVQAEMRESKFLNIFLGIHIGTFQAHPNLH